MGENDAGDKRRATRSFVVDGVPMQAPPAVAGLHLVATPIGNLADITLRALRTLAAVDVIYAEDTRHTMKLLRHYGIRRPLESYHEHNAARMCPVILRRLEGGEAVALVSDAGTPLISDPGARLVREAARRGLVVRALPGPSAVIAALAVSGLGGGPFLFAGFPPPRRGARRRFLEGLRDEAAALVLFESPHRVAESLADMADVLGPRAGALCRELTKVHEEVLRAPLPELARRVAARAPLRGEITLVVAPAPRRGRQEAEDDARAVEDALRAALREMPAGRAAAHVARRFGLRKAQLYERAVRLSARRDDEGRERS